MICDCSGDEVVQLILPLLRWPSGRHCPVVRLPGQYRDRGTELRVVAVSMDHHSASRSASQHIPDRLRSSSSSGVDRDVTRAWFWRHWTGGRARLTRRRRRLSRLRQDLWERRINFRYHGQTFVFFSFNYFTLMTGLNVTGRFRQSNDVQFAMSVTHTVTL